MKIATSIFTYSRKPLQQKIKAYRAKSRRRNSIPSIFRNSKYCKGKNQAKTIVNCKRKSIDQKSTGNNSLILRGNSVGRIRPKFSIPYKKYILKTKQSRNKANRSEDLYSKIKNRYLKNKYYEKIQNDKILNKKGQSNNMCKMLQIFNKNKSKKWTQNKSIENIISISKISQETPNLVLSDLKRRYAGGNAKVE